MPTLVKMPKWGLTMTAGTVTGWLRDEGAEIEEGDPLLTVETEKAVNDVEAPSAGVLLKIVAEVGSEIPVSGPIAVIAAPDEALSEEEIASLVAAAQPQATGAKAGPGGDGQRADREARTAARDDSGRVNASPAARKIARELGIDLANVSATGPGGRITSEDVERAAAEPADTAEVREDVVVLGDGRTISYLVAGPPSSTPLVFLHGLGGSRGTWENLLGELVEEHRVVALDLPGHGLSDKPAPAATDYSITGLAAAVREVLSTLTLAPSILVGHSLGGAVSIQIALDQPDVVVGLILVDSAGLGEEINPELLDLVDAEPSSENARHLLELFYEDKRLVLDRGVEEMHQGRRRPGAVEAERAVAGAAFSRDGQQTGLPARLNELAVPVLLISGVEDRVIPVDHVLAAARVIPDTWVKLMTGIGHVPQVEDASGLARTVDRFARAISG